MSQIPRRRFLLAAGVLLAAPLVAGAQPAAKMYRIGYLSTHSPDVFHFEVFRQALRELGWVEGRNLNIDFRSADGKSERLPRLAEELVGLNVNVIVAAATVPALAAKRATQAIPVVFTHVSDPVGSGLVASLARPSGNITGITHLNVGLVPKRLELLKASVLNLSRVVALWHPGSLGEHTEKEMLKETEDAARALGLQLQIVSVRRLQDLEAAFAAVSRDRLGPLIVLPAPIFRNAPQYVVELAAKYKLPAVYFDREFTEAGGLMAYGADMAEVVRSAARYVDKILKGTKPHELPVAQAMRFELTINNKTAKALGLAIPQSVLLRAERVIE